MIFFHKIYFRRILLVLSAIVFVLFSCEKQGNNNNNNSSNPTLQSQVVGNWKLVKEHWQLSNNADTIITSWSTSSGSTIPPTVEFGNQLSGQWYTGGMDKMGWGGPCLNPFTRGANGSPTMWAIEASTNRLIGAGLAKYDVVHIDANTMILSQENANNQYSFDTLWLERY